jgi:hypothetical protein
MMRGRNRIALVAAAILAAIALAVGANVAYAKWATTGSGTGTATTGTLTVQVQAIAGGDTTSGALIPGGTADAIVKVTNPHGFAVTLTGVVGNGAITAANACTPTGVTFADQNNLTTSIGAGATVLVHLPGAVSMTNASASYCQGTTFSIPVTATVRK